MPLILSRHKRYFFLAGILYFLAVWLPFLWLSFYNVPIGMHEWEWMTNRADQLPDTWWKIQEYFYLTEMGRYSSTALLSLTSFWCTLSTFPIFFFAWQLLWMITLIGLIRQWLPNIAWKVNLLIAFVIQIFYLAQLEDVYDTMFRYTGVITYQFGAWCFMIALIFLSRLVNETGKPWLNFIGLLMSLMLCIGSNEISMLIAVTACLSVMIILFKNRGQARLLAGSAVLLAIVCSFVVISAPGNTARISAEEGTMEIGKLVVMTFGATAYVWFDWISDGYWLGMTFVLIPLLPLVVGTASKIFEDFRPWLLTLVSIVPISLALLLYSTGANAFPERVIDLLFIHAAWLWIGLLISLERKYSFLKDIQSWMRNKSFSLLYYTGCAFFLLNVFGNGLSIDRSDKEHKHDYLTLIKSDSNPLSAWLSLIQGEAQSYHKQSIANLNSLYNCNSDTCFIARTQHLPKQLYDPLSDRRNRRGDPYIGYYFNQHIRMVRYE